MKLQFKNKLKRRSIVKISLLAVVGTLTCFASTHVQTGEYHTAALRLRLEEPTYELTKRAREIVIQKLNSLKTRKELHLKSHELKVSPQGNAVFLRVSSDRNFQEPVEAEFAKAILEFDQKVSSTGRLDFFKTNFSQPVNAILNIQLADDSTQIEQLKKTGLTEVTKAEDIRKLVGKIQFERIEVVELPVKEFLQTLKGEVSRTLNTLFASRVGEIKRSFGHSMDGSCPQRRIYLELDGPVSLDEVIEAIGSVLNVPGGV